MIATLEGILAEASPTGVVLDVNGIGYEVHIPVTTAERLPGLGQKTKLHIRAIYREDPQALFERYSLREEAAHHNGRLDINAYNQSYFPEITEVMNELEIGQVGGPVKLKEGYSVFKILERKQEKSPYTAESERRSHAYVKVDKAKRSYVKYVQSLREKYPVEINEEILQKISAEPKS